MTDGIAGGLNCRGRDRYPDSRGEPNEPIAKVSPPIEQEEKQNDDQQPLGDAAENWYRGLEHIGCSCDGLSLHDRGRLDLRQARPRFLYLQLDVFYGGLDLLQPLRRAAL